MEVPTLALWGQVFSGGGRGALGIQLCISMENNMPMGHLSWDGTGGGGKGSCTGISLSLSGALGLDRNLPGSLSGSLFCFLPPHLLWIWAHRPSLALYLQYT